MAIPVLTRGVRLSRPVPAPTFLVRSPRQATATCRQAAARVPMPPRCPLSIPTPDGAWGRARELVGDECEYLVDVEPGALRRDPSAGSIYDLLSGGRCRRFDLKSRGDRWPADGFFADDLRLVGRRPLRPGESAQSVDRYGFTPARARVLRRLRVGVNRALLLSYPAPLTTVHSGHLAIVWNETEGGYVVSGHSSEPVSVEPRSEDCGPGPRGAPPPAGAVGAARGNEPVAAGLSVVDLADVERRG